MTCYINDMLYTWYIYLYNSHVIYLVCYILGVLYKLLLYTGHVIYSTCYINQVLYAPHVI